MRFSTRIFRYVVLVAVLLSLSYKLLAWRYNHSFRQQFEPHLSGHSRPGYPYTNGPKAVREKRAAEVIDTFRSLWHGYAKNCFGQDELLPVSGKCSNSRNGWGASIVDALSTAVVTGQKDIVQDILEYIPSINFNRNGGWPRRVNVFETTIRYLGGLISAYDLLRSEAIEYENEAWHVDALLVQAKILADNLLVAFDTPSGVPVNWLWLELGMKAPGQPQNTLAAVGTLLLEWQRLADLTSDKRYEEAISNAERHLLSPKPANGEPNLYPGLLATWIDVETGRFADSWGSWGAGRDSAYEYMLKAYVYDHRKFPAEGGRWTTAADSTIAHAASYPDGLATGAFLMDWGGHQLLKHSDYLAAFAAGNFMLGGAVYREQKYIDFGQDLLDGIHALQATATGIGPERFSWGEGTLPSDQEDFYNRTGFWITESTYNVRPEVLESYYYAYRVTGDEKYQDWAWELFQNILNACKVELGENEWGLSSIDDVNSDNPTKLDFQDSFVFSEVLKYAYMIFADDDAVWHVNKTGRNEFVLNTEGHLIRTRCTMPEDLTYIGSCKSIN